MHIISSSARCNKLVHGEAVDGRNWKLFLDSYFGVPEALKISKNHIFSGSFSCPGTLPVKSFGTSDTWETFQLMP